MIHGGDRCWRSAKGESYLDPMQPRFTQPNVQEIVHEELPIAAKFWTNKVWITLA